MRSFFEEGINGADLSVFDRVAAPDVVYSGATVGDERVGGAEADLRLKRWQVPGIQYTLLTSVADGDAVALRFQCRGRAHRRVPGTGATGNTITWNHSAFAHVACGRITEMGRPRSTSSTGCEFGILVAKGPAARMAGAASPAATPAMPADSASCAPQSPEQTIAVVDRSVPRSTTRGTSMSCPRSLPGYLHGSANGPDAIGIAEGTRRIGVS